jgi:hypothetical protein
MMTSINSPSAVLFPYQSDPDTQATDSKAKRVINEDEMATEPAFHIL